MLKVKKKIMLFGILFSSLMCLPMIAHAEEITPTDPDVVEEVTYNAKIISSLSNGGDVLFDIEEGNAGDIVTAYLKPDVFFSVTSVSVNGNQFPINKDGKYQFQLVEGDNIFSATFEIDNEKLEEIAAIVNGVKKEGFESLFTVSNLLNFISWIISVLLGSGFFITLIRSKRLKGRTTEQISNLVIETINQESSKALSKFLSELFPEVLDKINLKIDNVDDCMKTLCRCFVLAQSDTPENRLAIITELTNLNNSDEALSAQIRSIVKEEQAAQAQALAERDKAIKELKENNESLVVEDKTGDIYGQI